MSVEENLKVFDELNEIVKKRDWETFGTHHTEDVITYSPMRPEPTRGIPAHTEAIKGIFDAFPDVEMKTDKLFGHDEWVFASFTFTGTHKGPLPGPGGKTIPPTNKKVKIPIANAIRFVNGKIAEEHTYLDRLSMFEQLGLNP
jgi:predicted ester cyclase